MINRVWAVAAGLLIGAIVGGSASAQAIPEAQWEPLGESAGVQFSLNPASVARSGDVATFQIRLNGQRRSDGVRQIMIIESSFDCAGRTVTALSYRRFDLDGRLVETRDIPVDQRPTEQLRARVPIYAAIFLRVCGAALPD